MNTLAYRHADSVGNPRPTLAGRFGRAARIWLDDVLASRACARILALPDETLEDIGLSRFDIVQDYKRKRALRRAQP